MATTRTRPKADPSRGERRFNCIFCTRAFTPGKKGEDVISDWYARRHHGPGKYTVEELTLSANASNTSPTTRHSQTVAGHRVLEVCPTCNNEWMSTIEQLAIPVLEPMIAGRRIDLSTIEANHLAAWVQLKATTLDAYYPYRLLPPELAHAFCNSRPIPDIGIAIGRTEPLDGVHVLVGRHLKTGRVGIVDENGRLRAATAAEQERAGEEDAGTCAFVFVLGDVVFFAMALVGETGLGLDEVMPTGPGTVPLWPTTIRRSCCHWPPPIVTPRSELSRWLI